MPQRPPQGTPSASGWSAPGAPDTPQRPANPYGPAVPAPLQPTPPMHPGSTGYGVGPQGGPGQHSPYATAQRPGIIPLRPLNLGDVLEASFAALRLSPAAVLGTMLLVALAEAILVGLPVAYLVNLLGQSDLFTSTGGTFGTASTAESWELVNGVLMFWGMLLAAAILATFLGTISQGVLSVVLARGAVGLKTGLGQAWRLTAPTIWSLVGLSALYLLAGLIYMVALGGLLFLSLLPAITSDSSPGALIMVWFLVVFASVPLVLWIYVKVLLAPAAVAIEKIGPWAGIRRSWGLTNRSWWRTFGVLLLVGLIVGIAVSLISGGLTSVLGLFFPSDPSSASVDELLNATALSLVVSTLITTLIQSVGTAYLTLVMAVLYIDYRIRQESFDLDLGQIAAQSGTGDQDSRFSTTGTVSGGSGTDDLVPGRAPRPVTAGPSGGR